MKTCQGTVPEQRIPQSKMVERTAEDGSTEYVREHWENIVPARPCDAEATMLARSMRQVTCELFDQLPGGQDGIHWLPVEDKVYCAAHFVAGTMEHLDGRVTQHAAMSVNDAN